MKKLMISVLVSIMLITNISSFKMVKAEEINSDKQYLEVIYSGVKCRTGPSTSYDVLSINGKYQYYSLNEVLEVLGSKTNSSGEKWYNVRKIINDKDYDVWVRSDFVILYYYEYDAAFEEKLKEEDFPSSYNNYLRYLHTKQPTWNFKAYHTNIEWKTILDAESVIGRNLVDGSNIYLRSKENGCYDPSTGKYIPLDGNNWYQANRETIEYFMDPRNFINSEDVFQFIKLSFTETETPDVIQTIINGTFMSGSVTINEEEKKYSQIFYDAGEEASVSPIYLATKARYEQGTSGSAAVSGEPFTYNGKTYSSLYNFYNIQATSGAENWKYGLIYANGGEDGKNTSYGRPWNNQEKSIKGGALWISDGYIIDGQDTLYAQKFNYVSQQYWHQYQTNVKAPSSEAGMIYKAYKAADCFDSELTFTIPVYLNMPTKTYLPSAEGQPANPIPEGNKYTVTVFNPYPDNITVTGEGEYVENSEVVIVVECDKNYEFVSLNIGEDVISEEKEYKFNITQDMEFTIVVNQLEIEPEEPNINFDQFITDFNLENKNDVILGFEIETKYSSIKKLLLEKEVNYQLIIKNENGEEIEDESYLGSSMIIEIKIDDQSKQFVIAIKGDVSGDGRISPVDYVLVKNHIMETGKLEKKCLVMAADMSDDNNISPVDYVLIKNIIMNGG